MRKESRNIRRMRQKYLKKYDRGKEIKGRRTKIRQSRRRD
jgi:hypothetical protein